MLPASTWGIFKSMNQFSIVNRHEHNVLQLYKEANYFSVQQENQDFVCVCVERCNSYLWNKFIILYKRDNNSTFSCYTWSCLQSKPWQLWGIVIAKVISGFYSPRMEYSQYNWNRYLLWHTYRSLLTVFKSQCSSQMCQTEADFSWFQ